ncbi:ImmA/IrrE family metallo-endopeptidase [Microbacterium hominis]|uniref:ImmA/IrrE family metallo-endopeptidase n=1 Tax=Microbacterium hominis TaxID=162426 RepID=UPI001CC3067C
MPNLSRTNQTPPRGRSYDPWAHAEQLGIDVVVRPLRTAHGLWLPDMNTIAIHSRIRAGAQRLVLAHEIGHADLGHRDDRPKHEHQADVYAARNLICPDELDDLYKWCPDEQRIISELGVTTRLFRAYVASG